MAWRSADESLALIGGLHGGMPAHEPESAPASRRLGGTAASDARPRGIGGAESLGRGARTAASLSQLEPPRGALESGDLDAIERVFWRVRPRACTRSGAPRCDMFDAPARTRG